MNNLTRRGALPVPLWRPQSIEDQFGRIVENMFEDLFAPLGGAGRMAEEGTIIPRMSVAETEKTYEVDVEMPGVKKEDVKVQIEHNRVAVDADCQKSTEAPQGANVLYAERTGRKYMRTFTLPSEIDDAGAQARLEDGILHLTLPKKQGAQAHRLPIQ